MLLKDQTRTISDLKSEKDAWYNSHTLWFVVGALATGAVVYEVKK